VAVEFGKDPMRTQHTRHDLQVSHVFRFGAGKPPCQVGLPTSRVGKNPHGCLQLANSIFDILPNVADLVRRSWQQRVLALEKVKGIALQKDDVDIRSAVESLDRPVCLNFGEEGLKRTRDNLHERPGMGYFMGKLGRGKVCCPFVDGVELPSDYQGVVVALS
jgi:hypothetical protein